MRLTGSGGQARGWWIAALLVALLGGCPSSPPTADAGGDDALVDVAPEDVAADSAELPDAADAAPEAGADTWATFAEGWFDTYCVNCHGVGNTRRDYTTLADVQRDADRIRCGVTPTALPECDGSGLRPRQFPVGTGPRPSDAERTRLLEWLAAGAP